MSGRGSNPCPTACVSDALATEPHRQYADLTLAYKLIKGFVDVPVSDIMSTYVSSSRGPSIKIRRMKSRTKPLFNYFGNRISSDWNKLADLILQCETVSSFKALMIRSRIRWTEFSNSLYWLCWFLCQDMSTPLH